MDNIQVRPVDVLGDTIMATQDEEGYIWAGVSYFCKALGMSNKQRDNQVAKVQTDKTLKKGTLKFQEGVFDPNNEAVGIRIDYIPLWLAKIPVTERMEQDHPDLADKLLNYQLKAKEILAAAFLPKQSGTPADLRQQIQTIAKGTDELYQRVDEVSGEVQTVKSELENLKNDMPVFTADAKDIQNALRKKAIEVLGGKDSNAYKDKSIHGYAFSDIQIELRRQFGVKRYDQIKHRDVPVALKIIEEYKPPIHIRDKIQDSNAQQRLDV
jgi:hypothetical protein